MLDQLGPSPRYPGGAPYLAYACRLRYPFGRLKLNIVL